ncbi:hypothetical protein FBUS_07899 [Fasciolopsis buskii]|uniref:Uncharacterized protein n=1 Tax=Fasciolopsis buskii TaxID=27845 RepID=A0A8E0S034_9TREM|nr:hypothetical protein FBUS_07899 [Fasciolopsis buski]
MGSCASTGTTQVESPARSLTITRSTARVDEGIRPMTPTRRVSVMTAKGFDQNNVQQDIARMNGTSVAENDTVDLLDLGRGEFYPSLESPMYTCWYFSSA